MKSDLDGPTRDFLHGVLHLLVALMEHPIRAPASHCWMIWDSQDLYAEAKDCGSLNPSTKGPRDGLSGTPAGMGCRSRGIGRSKEMSVEDGE